jgi:predicted transcriptional regulator
MDKKLEEKINQKINEVAEKANEIYKIINSLEKLRTHSDSFGYGIIIGRLYNSFYYQCRRILKRDPTNEEFLEFLDTLNKNQVKILDSLKLSNRSL